MSWRRGWEVLRLIVGFIITFCFSVFFFAIGALICFGGAHDPLVADVLGFSFDLKMAAAVWAWLSALAIAVLRTHRAWRRMRAERGPA